MSEEKTKYSFSRLTLFHTCPYAFYMSYILKKDKVDNAYSFLGKEIHSLLEDMQTKDYTNVDIKKERKKAIKKFNKAIDCIDTLCFEFPTEKSRENYISCISNYINNFVPVKASKSVVEEQFEIEIDGNILRGFIDLYTIKDGIINIYDYKTSSKFSKKELEIKKLQLIIYAMALEKKYPEYKIGHLYFDMLKYTLNSRGTLVERSSNEDKGRALVEVKYDDESIKQTRIFIKATINKIESLNPIDEKDYFKNINKFFCKTLCSYCNECLGGE